MDIWRDMRTSCFIVFLFAALIVVEARAGFITGVDGDLAIYTTYPSSFARSWTIRYSVTYSQFGTNPLPVVTLPTAFPDKTLTLTGNVSGAVYYSNDGQQESPDGGPMFKTNQAVGYNCIVSCEPQRHPTVTATDNQAAHGAGNEAGMSFETVVTPIYVTYSTNHNIPPDTNYSCYFDLQGVAFFDGQTNKYFTADLWVVVPENIFVNLQTYIVNNAGTYYKSYGEYDLIYEQAASYMHYWLINSPGRMEIRIDGPVMGQNPDNYHYVTSMDFVDWNTNSTYIPPDPSTNDYVNPYVEMPESWDTNIYGPYPPYYSPWPPNYPPPPPLNSWPAYPPPNWTYNTNSPYNPYHPPNPSTNENNSTNYPDQEGQGTNGNWTLSQFYTMLRTALRDEANAYIPSDPAQYGFTYSNDLLRAASVYVERFFVAGNSMQTNAERLMQSGKGVFDNAASVLVLPTTISVKEQISFGTVPLINQPLDIVVADWPVIAVFRALVKWCLYFMAFWLGFRLIRRTLARTE